MRRTNIVRKSLMNILCLAKVDNDISVRLSFNTKYSI